MDTAVCPVCHEFVGYVPEGWQAHVIHHGFDHSMTAERPPAVAHYPNPD